MKKFLKKAVTVAMAAILTVNITTTSANASHTAGAGIGLGILVNPHLAIVGGAIAGFAAVGLGTAIAAERIIGNFKHVKLNATFNLQQNGNIKFSFRNERWENLPGLEHKNDSIIRLSNNDHSLWFDTQNKKAFITNNNTNKIEFKSGYVKEAKGKFYNVLTKSWDHSLELDADNFKKIFASGSDVKVEQWDNVLGMGCKKKSWTNWGGFGECESKLKERDGKLEADIHDKHYKHDHGEIESFAETLITPEVECEHGTDANGNCLNGGDANENGGDANENGGDDNENGGDDNENGADDNENGGENGDGGDGTEDPVDRPVPETDGNPIDDPVDRPGTDNGGMPVSEPMGALVTLSAIGLYLGTRRKKQAA